MANEYLQRTPTSTGNQRVWTASLWYKMSSAGGFFGAGDGSSAGNSSHWWFNSDQLGYSNNDGTNYVTVLRKSRDFSSWSHYMVVVDTTKVEPYDRVVFYENGVRNEVDTTSGYTNPSRNAELSWINQLYAHHIGARNRAGANTFSTGEYCDFFFIDGQALTPDVFGFYKPGKGYISVGSTQATDFRPGQWVPKKPRVITTEINRRGGFGVNGFYLPMNDSNNFGADFHCTPNSIIKLQENLPQPKCRIDGVGDYSGSLRADPFAANLVLALPFVSGGLNSGFGDYSAAIKGSGSPKTFTANGNVAIANTASYYGSGAYFDGNGDYLRTSTNISDFQFGSGDFTIETWLWKSANGANNYDGVAALGTNGSATDGWFLEVSATRGYFWYVAGSGTYQIQYNVSPNTSQWNHLAVCRKGNTTTMYLNGAAVGINTNAYTVPATATTLDVGGYSVGNGNYWFNGYLQDLRVYKGVAKYTGGFDVPRPYTPVGIATWRAVPDTTANNFATLNGTSIPSKYTVSNGNLTFTNSTLNWTGWLEGTVGFSTGKYYWETRIDVSTDYHHIGIVGVGITHFTTIDTYRYGISYQPDGRYWAENNNLTAFQTGITQSKTVGDIVQVAVDMSNKRMWVGKNGTWFAGDPATGSSPPFNSTVGFNYTHYVPFYDSYGSSGLSINFGQNPTFSGNTTAGTFTDSNGKGLFKYQPPSGFLALCEDNLPTPAIADPGKYFKTVLYTGDGNTGRSITGIGFTPDLVWIKNRNTTNNHNLYDSVRGPNIGLFSDLTIAELNYNSPPDGPQNRLLSFDNGGISIGNQTAVNGSGNSIVAWCWRAGAGTTSTNTNGSITSVVSVNQDAGFSIVSYTGTGANATVGHGLGKAPKFILTKSRTTADDWFTYHSSVGNGSYILLDTTAASAVSSTIWNNTSPTTTTFSLGTSGGANRLNDRFIAYCWAEIEGFSKAFSYVGNGNADGPLVYLNFKPALIIIKRTDGLGNWQMYDSSRMSTNPNIASLFANTNVIEGSASGYDIDFLSNGFKLRSTDSDRNGSGMSYVGFAWAESPFTTSNSK